MPVWVAIKTDRYGSRLQGWYRTEASLDAAVAADSELTKVEAAILDADMPMDAQANADYYLYDAPIVPQVNATVEIQYGASGKGFRIEFSVGADGAEGNGWTITTGGSTITFTESDKTVELPRPAGTAADFLALLNGLSGTYQFTALYRTGTVATDDLSALANADWSRVDGETGNPEFGGGVTGLPARKEIKKGHPPLYTPRAFAALELDNGLKRFHQFVLDHADGIEDSVVKKVHDFLYQKRRANRMVFANDVTIGGVAQTYTDAEFIAWATFSRFGPTDTSAVTFNPDGTVTYNPTGLFQIFERADDPNILTPNGPITWVGLDKTQWTGGQPNRLTVAQIAPVLGTFPTKYLNDNDDSWLRA